MSEPLDEIDIQLRDPDVLTARMVALLATSQRESMEYAEDNDEDEYAVETDRFDLHAWMRSTFPETLTSAESAFLSAPIGDPDDDILEQFLMDAEAAVALGWALGIVDSNDVVTNHAERIDHLRTIAPKPWDRADKLRRRLVPRSEDDVWQERERWYLRRLRLLVEDIDASRDRNDAIGDMLKDGTALGLPIQDGDITFGGRPLDRFDDEEFAIVTSVVDAWTKALTWACSLGGSWDELDLDELD